MQNEGSTAGFVLSLIGGILSILLAIQMSVITLIYNWSFGAIEGSIKSPIVDPSPLALYIGYVLALYVLIMGIFLIVAGVWMRHNISLKKGAWTALILGILSLNILAIIGGAIGLSVAGKLNNIYSNY